MKTLHIVLGPPGAGKTTYGKNLAAQLSAAFIDIDTATEPVVRAGLELANQPQNDRDSQLFKSTFREPIYETLFALAVENISHVDVVIVGPFTKESRDSNWIETIKSRVRGDVIAHFVTCDLQTRRQRLEKRGNPRDRAKLADWETHTQYYEGEKPPLFPHHLEDTGRIASD